MLSIFNEIANLAAGTLSIAAAVGSAAPQVSAENQKQAALDLSGVALQAAAKAATSSTTNQWVQLASALLPALYDEVMTVVNKNGLIAQSAAASTSATAAGTTSAASSSTTTA